MTIELYLGDCLEILPTLAAGSVDAVVTDPPYGTKVTNWDESIDPQIFAECLRISRGYCAYFYSNTRLWHILGELHNLGIDCWVAGWHKNNAMGFERKFAPLWVPIVLAYNKSCKFFGRDVISKPIIPSENNNGHPTPKPVNVTSWLIENATNPGDTILDPFMGSGTTGVACVQTGRNFIGVEIDEGYFNIAKKRIEQAQLQIRMDI